MGSAEDGKPCPDNLLQWTLPVSSVTSKEVERGVPEGLPITSTFKAPSSASAILRKRPK